MDEPDRGVVVQEETADGGSKAGEAREDVEVGSRAKDR